MKKLQICLLVLLSALFAGCDTEGEFRDMSYYNPEVTFNPIELQNNYRITYNGSESPYISKSEKTFKLEVFKKDDTGNTPVLTENECPSDKAITLIQPIEKELAVYNTEKYISFTPSFSDISGCNVLFKTYPMTANGTNYIPVSELPGNMTIVSEADPETVLFTMPLTAESNEAKPYIMKLSDTEFLEVPTTEEADPAEGHFKFRIFFTADALPNYDELTFELYLANKTGKESVFYKTILLTPGQVSDYMEVDGNYYGDERIMIFFNIKDKNGNTVATFTEGKVKLVLRISNYGKTYKFMTWRITNSTPNNPSNAMGTRINDFDVEW